jgi:hypothetical protein
MIFALEDTSDKQNFLKSQYKDITICDNYRDAFITVKDNSFTYFIIDLNFPHFKNSQPELLGIDWVNHCFMKDLLKPFIIFSRSDKDTLIEIRQQISNSDFEKFCIDVVNLDKKTEFNWNQLK